MKISVHYDDFSADFELETEDDHRRLPLVLLALAVAAGKEEATEVPESEWDPIGYITGGLTEYEAGDRYRDREGDVWTVKDAYVAGPTLTTSAYGVAEVFRPCVERNYGPLTRVTEES